MKPHKMTNVELTGSSQRRAVSFMLDGARYHFWLHHDDFLRRGVLFKNSPKGVGVRDPGYFHTRRLDATKAVNKALIDHAMLVVEREGLLVKAEAAEREEAAAIARQFAEEQRIHRIKEAGPDLLAALRMMVAARTRGFLEPWEHEERLDEAVAAARAAIARAEGAP